MMQRILGPIPTKMAERSNLKYFSKVVSSVYNIYIGIYNNICTSPRASCGGTRRARAADTCGGSASL